MSLDMTMGKREAALDVTEQPLDTEAALIARLRFKERLAVATTALAVLLSSAFAVLLFLR